MGIHFDNPGLGVLLTPVFFLFGGAGSFSPSPARPGALSVAKAVLLAGCTVGVELPGTLGIGSERNRSGFGGLDGNDLRFKPASAFLKPLGPFKLK